MRYLSYGAVLALALGISPVLGQSFTAKATAGSMNVFQIQSGIRTNIADSVLLHMGDSLTLPAGSQALIGLETNTRLIFRGPGTLCITGDSSTAYLSFESGQVFLDRVEPASFSVLTFWVKNYMFVPSGTAAAIRVMAGGMPAVAVIEGKVLMQSPTGESADVPAGKFGSVETNGRLSVGMLGKKLVAALERWSGVKMGTEIPESNNSSSAAFDQEFIAAVSAAPPGYGAPAPAPKKQQVAEQSPAAPVSKGAAAGAPPAQEKKSAEAPVAQAAAAAPEQAAAEKGAENQAGPEKPHWEMSAGSVTVGDEQWTRLALGIDVPIWKFGIFFDIEAFIDAQGKFSNKGWDFKNEPIEAVARKIRYVRFGHEQDPLFVKVGGLSDVTLGYGFVVDRFTNMLHFPDEKLLGVQLYVNDVTPVGLTLQVFGADLKELRSLYQGGLGAARIAVRPLKTLDLPVIKNLAVGATYGYDRNTYAPARDWTVSGTAALVKETQDAGRLDSVMKAIYRRTLNIDPDSSLAQLAREDEAKKRVQPFGIVGGDIGLPILSTALLSLDVYAQAAMRDDSLPGWGFGAPGVALNLWKLNARLEYRHIQGRFVPGFFGPYYLDERLVREPLISSKAESLPNDTLNGMFGTLGFDLYGALTVSGSYQYLTGSSATDKDQRFEATGGLGSLITGKIPKVRKIEAYIYKTHIGTEIVKYDTTGAPVMTGGAYTYDRFFEKTPYLYLGYRLGIEISAGATLIWDSRYGWTRDSRNRLVPNNNIMVQTAFTF